MKTSELIGPALSWAVEEAQGHGATYLKFWNMGGDKRFVHCEVMRNYSVNWSEGGPIIERAHISLDWVGSEWSAKSWVCIGGKLLQQTGYAYGLTPLIAAMRCFVSSKLGDEIDIPKELQ